VKTYVLGAGVSKTVQYPLGGELLEEVDQFVRGSGPCHDRFDYAQDWPDLCQWLARNPLPLVAEAYEARQLEYVLTVLDLASVWKEHRFEPVDDPYQRYRSILLWALEAYLLYRHAEDAPSFSNPQWEALKAFGRKLCEGDVIITFNYDATLERVLLSQHKWSPRDGYGFEVVFEALGGDHGGLEFGQSRVAVLHLHGAVGWYRRPAPLETRISLNPDFLMRLGISAVDSTLPFAPPDEYQVLLHPSFLKDYELTSASGGRNLALTALWQLAAKALREANEIFVIGYSLPPADSAALTLLLTSCDPERVRIVNSNPHANRRLSILLSRVRRSPISFEDWLASTPDCQEARG
jgi:hypothetical protein